MVLLPTFVYLSAHHFWARFVMIAVLVLHLLWCFWAYSMLAVATVIGMYWPPYFTLVVILLVFFHGLLPIISLCAAIRVSKRKRTETAEQTDAARRASHAVDP